MILPAVVGAERLVAKRRAYAWLQNKDREKKRILSLREWREEGS
jgi:hypothetical protein